jgi:ribosomal protein L11 methylase PrmA
VVTPDPGSFRDPASRVVLDGGRVLRLLDRRGLEAWNAVSSAGFFQEAMAQGRVVGSSMVDDPSGSAAAALEHPRLPAITYPYEWTFSMLKDAALLQLDLLEDALAEGFTLKDATPFNIQFVGNRPVFIDVGSFEPYRKGEPWLGYRQFTRQFLFPLLMHSWLGIPFQPWLRGDPEGPTAAQLRAMLGGLKAWRPAAILHVRLQARLEERMRGRAVRTELRSAGFSADLILANVRRIRRLVASLQGDPTGVGWAGYEDCAHVSRDRDQKAVFLEETLAGGSFPTVLDLGANDGHFSRIAAASGAHAIAVDGDEAVLDRLYRELGKGEQVSLVLADLTNPPPSQGWRSRERPALFSRISPDLVIAYGLIHHLIYTASIPPPEVVDWLRSFDCPVVLEYVSPDDEMVAVLTANKEADELHPGRAESEFREILSGRFTIGDEHPLEGGTRTLFRLTPA